MVDSFYYIISVKSSWHEILQWYMGTLRFVIVTWIPFIAWIYNLSVVGNHTDHKAQITRLETRQDVLLQQSCQLRISLKQTALQKAIL